VSFPTPRVGLVIRYSFLWSHEADAGKEEGNKDRPCAIVIVSRKENDRSFVRVLPITHTPPQNNYTALEIPTRTKEYLGLDTAQSWVIIDEANDFLWPGPDLRPVVSGDASSVTFGMLPKGFMKVLMQRLAPLYRQKKARAVKRSE
jgi:hypothetical protein